MEIWANTYPSRLELIRKLQEKIVRAISFSDPRDHTRPIFENLSILPIDDLNNEAIALTIFSCMLSMLMSEPTAKSYVKRTCMFVLSIATFTFTFAFKFSQITFYHFQRFFQVK